MSDVRVNRSELERIRRVSAAEARSLVHAGRAVLVDTRDAASFGEAHAADAISLPFAEIRRSPDHPSLRSVPEERAVIFYCT
ncbi:MAG TPA: rhodanese-like domain-containing protein [Candidatus Limnocylindrales bacterium]|nr:rhodanese-like domain-containing protein [Candidatus Limnocylindrales bacterium]